MPSKDPLFYQYNLGATIRKQSEGIEARINSIPKEQFLISSDDQLLAHFLSELEIQALEIYEDSMEMDQKETQIDVSWDRRINPISNDGPVYIGGVRVTVSLPWTGESQLWNMRPSIYSSSFPYGEIRKPIGDEPGYLDIVIESPNNQGQKKIKQDLDYNLDLIRKYIQNQKSEIEIQNNQLPENIKRAIERRRKRLKEQEGISELLQIPIKRKKGAPNIEKIPLRRKLVRSLPPLPKSGFKAEPGINEEDYELILKVIRHEGRSFETTPGTFSMHDEEGLRNIILAHLNGHFHGEATGETFRKVGKTDIRIEDQDRAAFIAECKVWRGPADLTKAVDQLLGYLTWRDCKTAIVIFNKHNAKFTEILDKIPEALSNHAINNTFMGQVSPGEWKFKVFSKEDESREIFMHVFVFNLYIRKQN